MLKVVGFIFLIFKIFSADLIVFSYDRPLQLYALLESIEKNVQGIDRLVVIYRASKEDYSKGYDEVFLRFDQVIPRKQNHFFAQTQFKKVLLQSLFSKGNERTQYVLFGVDDIIVKQKVDLRKIEQYLEEKGAYAFFLRLGLNITGSYMWRTITGLPNTLKRLKEDVYEFTFTPGFIEWDYPNNLDMTVYRKNDIAPFFCKKEYVNPNDLESKWNKIRSKNLLGLCFMESKIVNIPLNLVNHSTNRHAGYFDTETLNQFFKNRLKMDVSTFSTYQHSTPHVDYIPKFIER